MTIVKEFGSFNFRRYSNPWIAIVDPKTAKPDFSQKVGGYTGGYNRGEAGQLYIYEPQEGAVYMYGQKDYYKSNKTERQYVVYRDGEFVPVPPERLLAALSGESITPPTNL